MDARALYNGLLEELHQDEQALEEQRKALERKKELVRLLKERIEQAEAPRTGTTTTALANTAQMPTSLFSPDGIKPSPTLVRFVADALPDLAGREFAVGDVADALRSKGVQLTERPNVKIATVLKRLEKVNKIRRTFTGAGNVPNRYVVPATVQLTKGGN